MISGSGTVYDLRHFSLGIAPNLARWDYHVTVLNQILFLATIDDDPIFTHVSRKRKPSNFLINNEILFPLQTAERWKRYMMGKKAMHN